MKLLRLVLLSALLSRAEAVAVGTERKGSADSEYRLNSPTVPSSNLRPKSPSIVAPQRQAPDPRE